MSDKALIQEARKFLGSDSAQFYDASLVRDLVDALEARQVDEAGISKLILKSLVFTNENSKPWADNLARAVVEFLGERHEPEQESMCGTCNGVGFVGSNYMNSGDCPDCSGASSASTPANEYGDAEESEAEYKNHAATVTREPTDAQVERVARILMRTSELTATDAERIAKVSQTLAEMEVRDIAGERLSDDLLAALDGAPEPEWEYRVEYQVPGGATHVSGSMDSLEEASGFVLENIHGGTVMRRRRAGEWLPVEGESK